MLSLWVLSWLVMPQYVQVLSLAQAHHKEKAGKHPTTQAPFRYVFFGSDDLPSGDLAELLVLKKGLRADDNLVHIKQYLHSLRLTPGLDNDTMATLFRLTAHFFILNGRLWR